MLEIEQGPGHDHPISCFTEFLLYVKGNEKLVNLFFFK